MHSARQQRRSQRTAVREQAADWAPVQHTGDTYRRAAEWSTAHPSAFRAAVIDAGGRRQAEQRARFFWHRLQSGKLAGAAAEAVRQRYRQWFERFALE